jgi:uncharacterized protein
MFLNGLLLCAALLGHFALAVGFFNRLHGIKISRRLRRIIELGFLCFFWGMLALYGWQCWLAAGNIAHWLQTGNVWSYYFYICCITLLIAIPFWLLPRCWVRKTGVLLHENTQKFKVAEHVGTLQLHGWEAQLFSYWPGNEVTHLNVVEKHLAISQLPSALHNLKIAHLSDLHFTGDMEQKYFDFVVDCTNQAQPDIIALTGDIIESHFCLPWLTETLGRLQARIGKYYVLGNHDLRMKDLALVHTALQATGFQYIGQSVQQVNWNDTPVLLAGDEAPWFAPPNQHLWQQMCQEHPQAFRLMLAHGPDRFAMAQTMHMQLMLAGHNHGGQVRFPLIGPLISPSVTGTKYASGLFYEQQTIMHVSRGISGEHAIRWNCAPELALLVLTQADS